MNFFSALSETNYICESADGKSNIYKKLLQAGTEENVLAIADGAALGSQMNLVSELLKKRKNFISFCS